MRFTFASRPLVLFLPSLRQTHSLSRQPLPGLLYIIATSSHRQQVQLTANIQQQPSFYLRIKLHEGLSDLNLIHGLPAHLLIWTHCARRETHPAVVDTSAFGVITGEIWRNPVAIENITAQTRWRRRTMPTTRSLQKNMKRTCQITTSRPTLRSMDIRKRPTFPKRIPEQIAAARTPASNSRKQNPKHQQCIRAARGRDGSRYGRGRYLQCPKCGKCRGKHMPTFSAFIGKLLYTHCNRL